MGYGFCCPSEPFLWCFLLLPFCIIFMVIWWYISFLLPFLPFEQARVFSASLHHSFNHLFSYRQEHFPPELGWPHATPQRREDVALRCVRQDLCQKRWAPASWLYPQPAVAFLLWDLWHAVRIMIDYLAYVKDNDQCLPTISSGLSAVRSVACAKDNDQCLSAVRNGPSSVRSVTCCKDNDRFCGKW